ncbi:CoA ester lyase [Thalassospiraceae bacterium LMO-JJ14]|nr:CoA ester lyase [Thalassospiraceae bacterium LMO-JJ14]
MSTEKTTRPRRSVLYMPGSNTRAMQKGRELPADGLILDLEDSVAPESKADARGLIKAALDEGGYGSREICVRTNGFDTEWGRDDVAAVAAMKCHAVVLPKVETAAMVLEAVQILEAAGAPADMAIWCMMETPLGILNAKEVAFAHARVGCLVMGTSDLAKDLNCRHTPDRLPFLYSLEHCLLAARAAGIAILDGVHLDLSDDAGFRASCEQGRDLGMDGKTLIHPKTIEAANEVFAPSEAEVAWARKIIDAHAEAAKEGKGLVVVDGKLIENLHVADAKRLLSLADAIASGNA